GAFHWRNTSRIRVCAFSYSAGEPCERSTQLIMYFIGLPLFCVGIPAHVSGPSVGRCGPHHKGADDEPHPDAMLPFTHSSGSAAGSGAKSLACFARIISRIRSAATEGLSIAPVA